MLDSLFCGENENMLLLIILILVLCGGDIFGGRDECGRDGRGGGLFDGNIIWIFILFLFLGDLF